MNVSDGTVEQLQVSAHSPVPRYFSITGNLGCTRWESTEVTTTLRWENVKDHPL